MNFIFNNLSSLKKAFVCFILLGGVISSPHLAKSQDSVPELKKVGHWNNPNLPSFDDGQKFNDIWGWTSPEGREYAIMGSNDSTYFLDITNPENPKVVDVESGYSEMVVHRDYTTHKHYCYAVNDDVFGTIQIFDLQHLPDSVEKVYDTFEHGTKIHNVFSDNGRLYLASNETFSGSNGFNSIPMTVLSLDDPENPTFLSNLTANQLGFEDSLQHVHDVFVHNDTAYCSLGSQGLMIVDYTNPKSPKIISHIENYPRSGYNHSSWTTANRETLVFADETHGKPLKVYDITNPKNPDLKELFGSNWHEGSVPHNPLIKDNLVYVSYYHEGLQIYDISDPANPYFVSGYDTYPENDAGSYEGYKGCWGVYPFFESGTIAATDMQNGLFLFRLDTVAKKNTSISEPRKIQARIQPNPFESELTITFEALKDQVVHYTFFDASGRQVVKGREKLVHDNGAIEVKGLEGQPAGMYWLKLKTGNAVEHHKVLKAR